MAGHALGKPPDGNINRSIGLMVGTITITVVSTAIVGLRIYVRVFVIEKPWWDDWTMLGAALIMIVSNGFLVAAYNYGIGRHLYYMAHNPRNVENAFKWLWAAEPTNLFSVYLVRVSISLLFLRIVPNMQKKYKYTIWGTIVFMTIADIYVSIGYFAQCRPIEKVWNPAIPGECFTGLVYALPPWFYQGVSIVVDIIILAIPIFLFRSLQIGNRKRIALVGVFMLGIFTTACAVVKTALLPKLFSSSPDHTWELADLCLWASLEACVGMVCGSIPGLQPLFFSLHGKRHTSGSSGNSRSHRSDLEMGRYRSRLRNKLGINNKIPSQPSNSKAPACTSEEEFISGDLGNPARDIRRVTDVEVVSHKVSTNFKIENRTENGWGPV